MCKADTRCALATPILQSSVLELRDLGACPCQENLAEFGDISIAKTFRLNFCC